MAGPGGGQRIDASVIGFDPGSGIFAVPDILAQSDILERADTVLVDSQTRAIFGPLDTGRVVDLDGHKVTIGGRYTLGTGFLGLAVVLASEDTFFRIFGTGPRPRPRDTVNLGLVTLKPGRRPRQGGAGAARGSARRHAGFHARRAGRQRGRVLDDEDRRPA